jgi:DNA-binding NarL/FixJ family response regulator
MSQTVDAILAEAGAQPVRVLIADDHKLFREGLRSLLERERGIKIMGEARNGEEAVHFAQTLELDVVLMDIEMPKIDGIEATRLINDLNLSVKVLMLSNFEEDTRVYDAMLAGAKGYVVKRISTANLVGVLNALQNDELILTPFLAGLALHNSRQAHRSNGTGNFELTSREIKILELLVKGYSNKEISNTIYISLDTVKAHLKHIFEKLGVDCRTKAAIKALKYNIIGDPEAEL